MYLQYWVPHFDNRHLCMWHHPHTFHPVYYAETQKVPPLLSFLVSIDTMTAIRHHHHLRLRRAAAKVDNSRFGHVVFKQMSTSDVLVPKSFSEDLSWKKRVRRNRRWMRELTSALPKQICTNVMTRPLFIKDCLDLVHEFCTTHIGIHCG